MPAVVGDDASSRRHCASAVSARPARSSAWMARSRIHATYPSDLLTVVAPERLRELRCVLLPDAHVVTPRDGVDLSRLDKITGSSSACLCLCSHHVTLRRDAAPPVLCTRPATPHVMTPLPRTVYGPPDWEDASLEDWLEN